MNKQIEEMAIKELADGLDITMCGAEEIFTYIIKQGYQKVDKDSVIISKAELNTIQSNFFDSGIKCGSKETAREILAKLKTKRVRCSPETDVDDFVYMLDIIELAKQYGVEIKE